MKKTLACGKCFLHFPCVLKCPWYFIAGVQPWSVNVFSRKFIFQTKHFPQTTVSTGRMKMFRLEHETMNVCLRNVVRVVHAECGFDKSKDILLLACTCEKTCESVWPPNSSLYSSSTCVHLRQLAGLFGQDVNVVNKFSQAVDSKN